jgi:hypothetical protein
MYYYLDAIDMGGEIVRNILSYLPDGGVQSFPDVESNTGPERAAYLAWVAEGNEPLPWPEASP